MIIIKNRELLIPEHERYIGTPIDNYADNRIFKIKRFSQSGEDLSDLTFRLDLKYPAERTVYTFTRSTTHTGGSVSVLSKAFAKAYSNAGTYTFSFDGMDWKHNSDVVKLEEIGVIINYTPVSGDSITIVSTISSVSGNVVLLEKEISENEINLIWHITENDTAIPGTVFVAIRGSDGDATVRYASYYAALYVDANLDQTALPASGITELEQLENMTADQLRKMEYLYTRYKDLDIAAQDAEAWAKGTRNGYPVPADDDTYQNNAKYYSDLREETTHLAEAWARGTRDGVDLPAGETGYHDNAKWWKDLSESWAVGATGLRTGENTNNSKYYADQSRIEGNGLASIFSDAVNYTAGDYVVHEGILYLFNGDHSAGPWTGTDAERVNLADGVTDARKRKVMKFNTCVDMKASTDLLPGMLCQTAGYYSIDDGGAALYCVMGSAPVDDYYETLQNGLIAVLIVSDTVIPERFGAYGDGTHDDTTALQAAVNYGFSNKLAVYLTKKYLITSPLVVKGTNATITGKGSVLLGNGSARIIAGATLTHVIETAPGADDLRAYGITVKDITIDGANQATDGFYSGYAFAGCVLENVIIRRCTIGLHIKGNCYLNSFNAIRTSYCTDYGIYFEGGNNTSNVFTKCYVESSVNAYRINGQYCSMISCCADSITGTVFTFISFNGTLVGCGSEARNFACMFDVSNNSRVNVIGGMFWGNPNLAEYYFRVGPTAYLGIKGCRINYTTSDMQSGALCYIGGTSELNLEEVAIYKDFPGENSISNTGSLHNNTAVRQKTVTLTLDDNNEADLGLNPQYYSVQSIFITGRTGWNCIAFCRNSTTTYVKVFSPSNWSPSISNKEFTFSVRYLVLSQT